VDVVEMTSDEIDKRNATLNVEEVFQNAPAVKGIKSVHSIQVIDSVLHAHTTTKAAKETNIPVAQSTLDSENLNVSSWCVVQYEDELFPGEIKAVVGDSYEVSVMVEAGKYWKWPQQEDKILYSRDHVLKALNPPVLINAWEHYDFPDFSTNNSDV
jgi:hypothetical protein